MSGNGISAGRLAEEAYRRFAEIPDLATAAMICQRAAIFRPIEVRSTGLLPIEKALQLFEQIPLSADYAEALFDYGRVFQPFGEQNQRARPEALTQALEVAESVGATALIPRILSTRTTPAAAGLQDSHSGAAS